MVSTFFGKFLLLLIPFSCSSCSFCCCSSDFCDVISVTSAWKSNLVTEATKCVGDDFLFHWPYSTRSDERSLPVFWVSDQNGTIGILYLDNFFPVSPRVQFDPSSGLTLKDLKTVDSGNYTVTVIGPNNTNINIQNVHLLVFGLDFLFVYYLKYFICISFIDDVHTHS